MAFGGMVVGAGSGAMVESAGATFETLDAPWGAVDAPQPQATTNSKLAVKVRNT